MLKEIAQGMAFTLRQMFRKPITLNYPEEQKPTFPRHRGRHMLHRYDNGLERCIGCELCSAACPVGCIYVLPAENDPEHPVSPGERYAARYEINLMRCIYCGYCAEACPTEAITLGPRYDLADYRREHTVVTKAELLESWPSFTSGGKKPSTLGAGADQRGHEQLETGVDPVKAWDAFEDSHVHPDDATPGHGGLEITPPTVKRVGKSEGERE
ncbi:MAG: NADH-quinone oxidoreductase subunit NuoI [Candidatus Dormibacteria bacterium]